MAKPRTRCFACRKANQMKNAEKSCSTQQAAIVEYMRPRKMDEACKKHGGEK